jgi:rubredoxin
VCLAALTFHGERCAPIPIRLECPSCGELHVDKGDYAIKPHHTHACRFCGAIWRPAIVATVGVRFLPGFEAVTGASK